MGAVRFLPNNAWVEASHLASTSASALPPDASGNPDRTYTWRSATDTVTQYLYGTVSPAVAATMIAVANMRRINGGVVTLQEAGAGASPGTWTDVVVLPVDDEQTKVSVAFFTSVTAKYWRLKFQNGLATADYAEAGYVGLGEYFEPSRVMPVGYEIPINDPSIITQSVGGQETGTARTQYMTTDLSFVALTTTDMDAAHAMIRAATIRMPIFVVLDTDLEWQWYLGRLRSPMGRTPMKGRQFALRVGFEEAR